VPGLGTRLKWAKRLQWEAFSAKAPDVPAVRFGARHEDTPAEDRELMAEVPAPREDHCRAGLLDGGDHFLVALRAAGLDEGGDAGA
jgi:hypothetical protein